MSLNHIDMLLCSMANYLNQHIKTLNRDDVLMLGIHTGGVWVAKRLHSLLNLPQPLGKLNIAFYRDDFSRIGLHPHVKPSTLPIEVDNRHIILVDDVLHTGRTIRAAFNEIFDYGRPKNVTLATLVERNGRELPIQPDVIGCSLSLEAGKTIKLCGPDPLSLEIRTVHE
ncbi:MAG: bifunctional pyr operon transcriptional regulator/uracil phosphoribosyltransferase PyrR [Gammaproteobacteria bacterium]|nr:MAG: bifunctional pyr operon transcriptional regulator/uracil phosphoribosyltransferase PyrR [Gammaproteobacteria bacterium]RKZ38273.1 MAG: bifunctional pyr operon transcriptional regulator/uracil phosphoribosyltransferase PyrR [Gammaproteobacteria bacterium]RKZ73973.1 MAG: bifunctional pyr operon transcriptional regulator/uracil phosphoribosyltransferase PyrR [Gammaproteobacteria bacterium]